MRFNPPPGWPPVPPGWTPPPGWQPDPSWPPVPAGWQLWLTDAPAPRRIGLVVGLVIAGAVVAIAAVVAVVLIVAKPDGGIAGPTTLTNDAPPSRVPQTDEEQIRGVIEDFEQAWNDADFQAFEPIICAETQSEDDFTEPDFLDIREAAGRLSLDVESIDVMGDSATATVSNDGDDINEVEMQREADGWKVCQF